MSIYTDPYNARLLIEQSEGVKADVRLSCLDGGDVDAPAADLPKIVAELYEAAGLPAPIILDRPDERELTGPECVTSDGRVMPWIKPSGEPMTAAEARHLASWYAAAAERAEAGPDPQQVKQIADLLMEQAGWHRHPAELAAKAILRAGYTRSES